MMETGNLLRSSGTEEALLSKNNGFWEIEGMVCLEILRRSIIFPGIRSKIRVKQGAVSDTDA
jgi:hypothetical protein